MADRWALVLAAATVGGALRPSSLPLAVGVLVAGGALLLRRPSVLCLGAALLASALAHRALAGLEGVVPRTVDAEVTLLTDPEPALGGVRAEARLGGRRVELRAGSGPGEVVRPLLAGERVAVSGDVRPLPREDWLVARHLAARLTVHRARPLGGAGAVPAAANLLRRALVRGAASLDPDERALYTGLVVGDDRGQPPELTDAFRGAGLTHLLAVSGQNVAFLLALAGPALRRLRLWPRLAVTLAVVGLFVVLTRAEPSVVRAGAMAALAASTVTIGRPLPRLRGLGLAVAGLVLVDPLLVRSLGFRLSVAAALAIVALAAPLAAALPGPRWLAEAVGVTVAAQLGVAPFLVTAFGPLPAASLPANLLAVPAAGVVMGWGMSVGLLAGVVGTDLAAVLHLPTSLLLWWVRTVAERAAAAPLGQLGAGPLAVLAGAAGLAVAGARLGRPAVRRLGAVLACGCLVATVAAAAAPPPLRAALRPGVVRWHARHTDVVVLGGAGWPSSVSTQGALEALREAHVGAIDLLVLADGDVGASVAEALGRRHPLGAVLVPAGVPPADRPEGAIVVPSAGATVEIGDLAVVIVPGERRLVVEAWPAPR